jgi:hypothetical protein
MKPKDFLSEKNFKGGMEERGRLNPLRDLLGLPQKAVEER